MVMITDEAENVEGSLWIGCSLRLMSRRTVVFGCHSRNASRSSDISFAKKWATRSSATRSRNDHGIWGLELATLKQHRQSNAHLVVILLRNSIERLNLEIRVLLEAVICEEKVVHRESESKDEPTGLRSDCPGTHA